MSTYRVVVKYWDRHYGDGHTQFRQNFEARRSAKADKEAIDILENALKTHSKPQGRIAEAWAERSDRGYPTTLRKYDGTSGSWVRVDPIRPATQESIMKTRHHQIGRRIGFRAEARRSRFETETYSMPVYWASYLINGDASGIDDDDIAQADAAIEDIGLGAPVDVGESEFRSRGDYGCLAGDYADYTFLRRTETNEVRETHRVQDFNTLDDLIAHARDELGATHVLFVDEEIHLYFPRQDDTYEKAEIWQKDGYWHAQGPGARTIVQKPPSNAQPIGGGRRAGGRAVETPTVKSKGFETKKPKIPGWYVLYKDGTFQGPHPGGEQGAKNLARMLSRPELPVRAVYISGPGHVRETIGIRNPRRSAHRKI